MGTRKIDSKEKGDRTERSLCKILSDRFGRDFSRSIGSGNRWGQVRSLTKSAREVFSGDICPPEGFRWTLECKGGYEDAAVPLPAGRSAVLDKFIAQASADATRCGRLPMVAWKRDRRPWLVMVREGDMPGDKPRSMIIYYGWAIFSLSDLLDGTDDSYWFGGA